MDVNKHPTSLAQLRKFLQKTYPLVDIVRGQGYYYFVSEDHDTSMKLHKNTEQGIYVFNCREMTFDQWQKELEQKLNNPSESLWCGTEEE
jgi:hypothetical protein